MGQDSSPLILEGKQVKKGEKKNCSSSLVLNSKAASQFNIKVTMISMYLLESVADTSKKGVSLVTKNWKSNRTAYTTDTIIIDLRI